MSNQRIALIALALFLLAASVASHLLFGSYLGWMFPFIAPAFFDLYFHTHGFIFVWVVWGLLLLCGISLWRGSASQQIYPFVVIILLLVAAGEYFGVLLSRG